MSEFSEGGDQQGKVNPVERKGKKTYTLSEMTAGLQQGLRYKRPFDDGDVSGTEYLTPLSHGSLKHEVVGDGDEQGGWGGSSTVTLSTLGNGRCDNEGWILVE